MKLKKKVKVILVILFITVLVFLGYYIYKNYYHEEKVEEIKVVGEIRDYGYSLKDNKTDRYKKYFDELKKILSEKEVNEEEYVKKITEMFIYDFFSLKDKNSRTDVGGVDFVHKDILENFVLNAENTYYKYVESNIYHTRSQSLPVVDKITISEVTKEEYKYNETEDKEAYKVKVSWDYTTEEFAKYQNQATLIFIHEENGKLDLVELS